RRRGHGRRALWRRLALRRRRQPAPELDRREPDDDDHRDGTASVTAARPAVELRAAAARRRPPLNSPPPGWGNPETSRVPCPSWVVGRTRAAARLRCRWRRGRLSGP